MKINNICLALISLFIQGAFTQDSDDPFNWDAPIVINSSDIFLLWGEGADQNTMKTYAKAYKYNIDSAGAPVENRLANLGMDSSDVILDGHKKIHVTSGNLDADEFDDIIAVWERSDNKIEILIPLFDTTDVLWNTSTSLTIDGPVVSGNGEQGRIFVKTGNFDSDETDEFLIAYLGADLTIHIEVFDTKETLIPELTASINDEDLSAVTASNIRFAVETGDFNNDGDDEIVLLSYNPNVMNVDEQGLYAKIYEVNGTTITPKAKEVIIAKPDYSISAYELAVTTVPFYATEKDEFAIAFTFKHNESPNEDDTFLQMVLVNSDLNSFDLDNSKRLAEYNNPNSIKPVLLKSGDLNNDGEFELVFAFGNGFSVYTPDSVLNLNVKASGGIPGSTDENADLEYSYEYLAVSDIDQTEGDEIAVVRNIFSDDWENPFSQHFNLSVYGTTDESLNSLTLKAKFENKEEVPYEWPNRNYALALGNFDASKVIIEEPEYYRLNGVNQPLVILNTPPVHFDIFDNIQYDINDCYGSEDCDFFANYIKTISETSAVTTELQAAWDVTGGIMFKGSTGVEVSAEPGGVGVAASIEFEFENYILGKYGEHLENTNTQSKSVSVHVKVTASEDDQIYATFTDYDVWRYPYREGNSKNIAGSIYVFVPLESEGRWYPSKSASGSNYKPTHEIGNILSYSSYGDEKDNPEIFQDIFHPVSSETYTLNSGTSFLWEYAETEFNETTALTAIESSLDVKSQGFLYFQYEESNAFVYTQQTSLSEELTLATDLGHINTSYGPTEYRITPYIYWSKQGALVIDYSVEPEIDDIGVGTWWQEKYEDNPDVTFILPWKYDPEKGFGITEEEKRRQTRDIVLDPPAPIDGDTVLIKADIRNFSLKQTDEAVKVKFYIGKPEDGGTLINNINGETEVSTDGTLLARDHKTVEFKWIVPVGTSKNARIYAVIDPDNSIDELHENNNIGWASFKNVEDEPSFIPSIMTENKSLRLGQNFPNPFSESTIISYTINEAETVTLHIYDVTGTLLRTINEGFRAPGSYSIEIDGSVFETGVYIYNLQGNFGTDSKKMIVVD